MSQIYVHWKLFGNAGPRLDSPASIIGTYLCRGPDHFWGKSLVRRADLRVNSSTWDVGAGVHVHFPTRGVAVNSDLSCRERNFRHAEQRHFPLQLNHYRNQALDSFEHAKLGRRNSSEVSNITGTALDLRSASAIFAQSVGARGARAYFENDLQFTGTVDVELASKRGKFPHSARAGAERELGLVTRYCLPPAASHLSY